MKLPASKAEYDAAIYYLARQLTLGVSEELVHVPEEISRCHDLAEIRDFCKQMIRQNPKLADLYVQGKTGPLIGMALKASYGRLEGEDIQQALGELLLPKVEDDR